ncbi:CHRD domain-containing protein [Novosphingobium sp. ZN18A2]|uniref:CHRD domain-containing protein n=1 Tax=Novosphingobium sp. ZN18A2 TaxID=3079861 RepID=UPI0030CB471B
MNRPILIAAAALSAAGLSATPATAESGTMLSTQLQGANEVPGPGMTGATGQASVMVYPDRGYVCWSLDVQNAGTPNGAHIHKATAGREGGVVVPLETPEGGMSQGCKKVDKALAADLATNPAGYYINVHNAEYPKGAVRGQLMP